jgi:hypothetical protein
MSNIPKAREALLAFANQCSPSGRREIMKIVRDYLYREPRVRRAPVTSKKLTPKLRAEIKALAKAHPDWAIRKIGLKVGVDGGRVSEVLTGKR